MARDYARIMTAIWKNKEFRALTEQQQRAYLFLVTQPDISAAGVLPLRVRRWADCASTSTSEGLAQLFKELEAGRFIVVDWDKEELLIRSFIRWDGGFNNPKRRPVIIRAAEEVESELIAHHVEMEFKRCGIGQPPPDGPSGGAEPPIDPADDRAPDSLSKIDRVDLDGEPFPQVNSLSGSASTNHGRVPQPTTHNPQPTTHNPVTTSATADAASKPEDRFDEFWAAYPRKTKKQDAIKAWRQVTRKVEPDRLIAAASAQADRWRAERKETRFVPYPASWLRGGSYDDQPEAERLSPVTDTDPAAAFDDLRRRGAAAEAARLLGAGWIDPNQHPDDPTPAGEWLHAHRVAFIDRHADQLRDALAQRQAS